MSQSEGGGRSLLVAASGIGLVAIGVAIGAAMWRKPLPPPPPSGMAAAAPAVVPVSPQMHMTAADGHASAAGPMSAPAEAGVTLTPEMMARAGIRTVPAMAGTANGRMHLPGVVQPNGYKEVVVTPLVSGRVTQVNAELGKRVAPGDVLASLYSQELADAQTSFVAARAELAAHDQRQTRAQRLYAIGAVSRQELDFLEAEGSKMGAAVESARARLILFGVPDERTRRLASLRDVSATFDVPAPMAGVITKRGANPGLNVNTSTPLFTVVDLSTVWVIADLYERDFARVRVGNAATVTTASYPGLALKGQVGYIDPQVQEETRTAKLRVEVPNAGGQLRFGMYVDVGVGEEATGPVVFVPKTAVQIVGAQSVVYVASEGQPGRFVQRNVEVAGTSGDRVGVLTGVQPGDRVVIDGAFFIRAEQERIAPAPQ
jgi:cobalt-zinc-cadmium efflux system membrane fusion protein